MCLDNFLKEMNNFLHVPTGHIKEDYGVYCSKLLAVALIKITNSS